MHSTMNIKKIVWLLYLPLVFKVQEFYVLLTECISVIYVHIKSICLYFPIKDYFFFTNEEEVFIARYELCFKTQLGLIHVSDGFMNS